VPKSLSVPRTSLHYNLEVSARRYPGKSALHYYGTDLAYTELARSVDALAGYLQRACGVRRGDRVLLYTQNSPQFVIGYYAILRADAVVVPVNPMNRRDELAYYIADTDARVIVSTQDLHEEIAPHLGKGLAHCVLGAYSDYLRQATDLNVPDVVRAPRKAIANGAAVAWDAALGAGHAPGAHEAGPDDLAVLPYTSGTTGHPKGTMLTHSNLLATSTGACVWYQGSSEAVALGVLPLFHLTGMQANMNTPIQLGATTVLMTRWDRDTAAELIQRCRVTGVTGITTMIVDFLANPDLAKYDLSSLTRIGGGGAAMPEAVAAMLQARIGLPFFCKVRPNLVDTSLADLLAAAGCSGVGMGIESGDDELRNGLLERGISRQQIVESCCLLKARGIRIMTFNMLGLPGETYARAKQTLDLNVECGVDYAAATILQPYPRTEIARRGVAEGWFDGDFERIGRDMFDQLYRDSERWGGLVMSIALHPYMMGAPHRVRYLDRLLGYLKSRDQVWWATGAEIADCYLAQAR